MTTRQFITEYLQVLACGAIVFGVLAILHALVGPIN